LLNQADGADEGIKKQFNELERLLHKASYPSGAHTQVFAQKHNPNIALSAARRRKVSLIQDYYYATMSLYGLATNFKSENQKDPYTYSEMHLEHAFAAALNKERALLAQWFIHEDEPHIGATWKARSRNSRPPGDALPSGEEAGDIEIIATPSGYATFKGKTCLLMEALNNSKFAARIEIDDYLTRTHSSLINILGPVQLEDDVTPWGLPSQNNRHVPVAEALISTFGQERVLFLLVGGYTRVASGILLLQDNHDKLKYIRLGIFSYLQSDNLNWVLTVGQSH